MTGMLYLIGVGPGDPELLTLKAVRLLGEVDAIAYPSGNGESQLALGIADAHINPNAERLAVTIPMRVERAPAQAAYDRGADAIFSRLSTGKSVAYLCEGDPLFYGSAIYLLARMAGRAEITVVPGVTSLTAAAAALHQPLATRDRALKVLPATMGDAALRAELALGGSFAFIKIGRHFDRVRALLEELGLAAAATIVEHATGPAQRITRLTDFAHDERPYFSIILVATAEDKI